MACAFPSESPGNATCSSECSAAGQASRQSSRRRTAPATRLLASMVIAVLAAGNYRFPSRPQFRAFACVQPRLAATGSTQDCPTSFTRHHSGCQAPAQRQPTLQQTRGVSAASAAALNMLRLGGFSESFMAILVSELGDKTFFLTMILALRRGRAIAMISALSALWAMTLISTGIGVLIRKFPSGLVGSELYVRIAAALLMVYFGVQSLVEAYKESDSDELAEAETDFAEEEANFKSKKKNMASAAWELLRFTALIFLAEWGDRSMFATVALAAAAKNPFGVVLGGCAGHLIATILAVVSGDLLQKYLSDRVIKLSGGVLFLIFGVTTVLGVY